MIYNGSYCGNCAFDLKNQFKNKNLENTFFVNRILIFKEYKWFHLSFSFQYGQLLLNLNSNLYQGAIQLFACVKYMYKIYVWLDNYFLFIFYCQNKVGIEENFTKTGSNYEKVLWIFT